MANNQRAVLLSAVTGIGNGTALDIGFKFVNAVQVVFTGTPTAVVLTIKGSLDGTNFDTLATFDTGAGLVTNDIIIPVQARVWWVRADLGTLTAGTNPTVTVIALCSDIAADGSGASSGGTLLTSSSSVQSISSSVTRPTDTNAYAISDAWANSTSAPTTGGFTLTGMARLSGGSGLIKDAAFSTSAGTALQGEIWLFDQAVTAINDNAAFTVSDGDMLNFVGVIPFLCTDTTAANAASYVTGLDIGYTCIGSANLRYLVKVMAAVSPGNGEVLSVRLKVQN